MKNIKHLASALALLFTLATSVAAQNGSNSSYSRFGLGTLDNQSQTYNRGMAGVSYAVRDHARINSQNPASYSGIDSLSFIFDLGMTLQTGHLENNGQAINVNNTTLSNINAAFRLCKGLGMSFGFMPYTTIGYNFGSEGNVGNTNSSAQPINTTTTYSGDGGIHQLYIGAGWNPFADLSVGANISYLWGTYNHSMAQKFYENGAVSSAYSNIYQNYTAELSSYKIDLGLQYPIRLNKNNSLTLGATYTLGHTMSGSAKMLRFNSTGDTLKTNGKIPTVKNGFDLPHTIGAGIAYRYKNSWLIAADYTYSKWGDCNLPAAKNSAQGITFEKSKGAYMDCAKYAVGIEYTPNPAPIDRSYIKTIRYRAGFSYTSPYLKVNGSDGPCEYRATVGLGFPLQSRKLSGRSSINISAEWMQRKPNVATMIKENYLLVNLGITFNEKWFQKWKFN